MILIEVIHSPPSPRTPTLKVAANESDMRPLNCSLQFGFRPTNRNPEPLKYRWSSRVSPHPPTYRVGLDHTLVNFTVRLWSN